MRSRFSNRSELTLAYRGARTVMFMPVLLVTALFLFGCAPEPKKSPRSVDPIQLEILLGASAKRLCSAMFVSGLTKDEVLQAELDDVNSRQMKFAIDKGKGLVEARLLDQLAQVLYRPHLGCTLVKDTTVTELREQFNEDQYPLITAPDSPWPLGDRVTLPNEVEGIDLVSVNRAVDDAFLDIEEGKSVNTRAVLVAYKNQLIAERYAAPFDATTPQLGWSMTKTVTNLLTGILVADGKLVVEKQAPVPEWQVETDDPRGRITLNNLLQMSSGLEFSEVYTAGSLSDVIVMLYAERDAGAYTARKPSIYPPDEKWSYASGTTNLISRIHRQSFDNLQSYFNFPRKRLFNPLGMSSAVIEPDTTGVFVGSSYMYATPRDWAKIGVLFLNDGVWDGVRLLPEGWVEYSLTPANAAPRGNYGAQIWLNRGDDTNETTVPRQGLPSTMYYLSGFEGQNVVVIPEHDLIIVRMGLTRSGPRPIWELTRRVIKAINVDKIPESPESPESIPSQR